MWWLRRQSFTFLGFAEICCDRCWCYVEETIWSYSRELYLFDQLCNTHLAETWTSKGKQTSFCFDNGSHIGGYLRPKEEGREDILVEKTFYLPTPPSQINLYHESYQHLKFLSHLSEEESITHYSPAAKEKDISDVSLSSTSNARKIIFNLCSGKASQS